MHNTISDTLESLQNDQLITDLQNTLIIEKQNYEHALLKKEQSRLMYKEQVQASENRFLWILVICACIVITASVIIFIYRSKGAKLKQSLSENALEMRNREFTNLAMYIKQRGTFINLIRDDLKVIRKTNDDAKKDSLLTALFVKVGTYAKIDNESAQIKEHIEMSTKGLISQLDTKFPNLTRKEKRLAQLLYMDLSSKEIALILNIAPQSVDTARYRLRKKLDMKSYESLNELFSSV